MMWFDRNHPDTVFGDIRSERHVLCDGRALEVSPRSMVDFRSLPFADGAFKLVVFDPPHLKHLGSSSWMHAKYGALSPKTWKDDIAQGFSECFRVLQDDGILIFKWNETQIKTKDILALTARKPLFGHPSGKRANTHWITFMKTAQLLGINQPSDDSENAK